jgi:stage II sporulation protein AA (anti-sigma F factor antagonist)
MPLTMKKQGDRLSVLLRGDIDHHSALPLRNAIDEAISRTRPKTLRLDFSEVTFMDSSGIGLVLGRYRNISTYGGALELSGLSLRYLKIMRLSGIEKIAKIRGGDESAKATK